MSAIFSVSQKYHEPHRNDFQVDDAVKFSIIIGGIGINAVNESINFFVDIGDFDIGIKKKISLFLNRFPVFIELRIYPCECS